MMNPFLLILWLAIFIMACNDEEFRLVEAPLPAAVRSVTVLAGPVALAQTNFTPTPQIQTIPSVIMSSPVANQQLELDKPTIVVARAIDPQGVIRVELFVNDQLVS